MKILLSLVVLFVFTSCGGSDDSTMIVSPPEETNSTIGTIVVTDIDISSALVSVSLNQGIGKNISEKGFVYGANANVNIDNGNILSLGEGDGGVFTTIYNLEFDVEYFVKAYLIDQNGIVYSDEISFTTTNDIIINCDNVFFGDVYLNTQQDVEDFGAEGHCTVAAGFLYIYTAISTTDPITDLTPLNDLENAMAVLIEQNYALTSLEGLNNLKQVFNIITINSNEKLADISALSSLQDINNITIGNNPLLEEVDAFFNLRELFGLTIVLSPSLGNINGFSNLRSIGRIILADNNSLQNLNGFESLELIQSFIEIEENESLTDFCGLTNVLTLNGLQGEYRVSDNAFNPTQQDIIDGNCSQ
jgi:hypothetical protein